MKKKLIIAIILATIFIIFNVSAATVTIGSNKELSVNNEQFFPIFAWSVLTSDLAPMKQDGLNTAMVIAKSDELKETSFFTKLEELGMYGVVDGTPANRYLSSLKGNNRLLSWLVAHEPEMDNSSKTRPQRWPAEIDGNIQAIKQIDNSKPMINLLTARFLSNRTYIGWNQWMKGDFSQYYPYAAVGDILVYDFYPVGIWGTNTDKIVDLADATKELRYKYANNTKPVWAIVEANKDSSISPVQVRNEVWSAIINGATGIGYWGYNNSYTKPWDIATNVKAELVKTNARIENLKPVLFSNPYSGVLMTTTNNRRIDFSARNFEGYIYIIAANLDMARLEEDAEFSAEEMQQNGIIEVLDEARTIQAIGKKFTDHFTQLAVHIYKIPTAQNQYTSPYGKWTNGPSTSENFFPIGVYTQEPANLQEFKNMGINHIVGLWDGPVENELVLLKNGNFKATSGQTQNGLTSANNSVIIAWDQMDEPDNAQSNGQGGYDPCVAPSIIVQRYNDMKAKDTTRPILLNFGRGVADETWVGRGDCYGKMEMYPEYIKGADIISFDIYPVANCSGTTYGKLEYVAKGVERLVNWADGNKIVWSILETTRINCATDRPTVDEIKTEVWMSIIHGSMGIGYFVHEWYPSFKEDGIMRYPEIVEGLTKINARITSLATVLNSSTIKNRVTVSSTVPIKTMLKEKNGKTYLFAVAMQNNPTNATITISGLSSKTIATVLDEQRQIQITNGQFLEDFNGYGVHLYEITNSQTCAQQSDCSTGENCCTGICKKINCTTTIGCSNGQQCINPETCNSTCQNINCLQGTITSACYCGGTARTSGYCCNGIFQTIECGKCSQDNQCQNQQKCCNSNCIATTCTNNTNCNDNNNATTDNCITPNTCTAACNHTTITTCLNSDGYCPTNCNSLNDNDCLASCGNHTVELNENCKNCATDVNCISGTTCCNNNCEPIICNNDNECNTGQKCLNSGTCNATCTDCNISCNSDSQCNDNNSTTTDKCNNLGECDSYCSNEPVTCGENICISGQTCCNNQCITPACTKSTQCNDNDKCTTDKCSNAGKCNASCTNTIIPKCGWKKMAWLLPSCIPINNEFYITITDMNNNPLNLVDIVYGTQRTQTDNTGNSILLGEKNQYNIKADKNGYISLTGKKIATVTCNPTYNNQNIPTGKEIITIKILEKPIIGQPLTVTVLDKNNSPITNATISYGTKTTKTDTSGKATVTPTKGLFTITATAAQGKTTTKILPLAATIDSNNDVNNNGQQKPLQIPFDIIALIAIILVGMFLILGSRAKKK